MTVPRWRKSSYSGTEGECIELLSTLDAVRDSKNPDIVLLTRLDTLVRAVKGGRLDRL